MVERQRSSEEFYKNIVAENRSWMALQAERIGEESFPELNDGSKGLIVGTSSAASWRMVLRPDGALDWVDLLTHKRYGFVTMPHYLSERTLSLVESAVEERLQPKEESVA